MKLPQTHDNFIKTQQGKNTIEYTVGAMKGKSKVVHSIEKTTPKRQSTINASLTGQRSKSTTPPFLITFEIFNRNVHNYMVDSRASSNVMPLKVCEKLNVKHEPYDILN